MSEHDVGCMCPRCGSQEPKGFKFPIPLTEERVREIVREEIENMANEAEFKINTQR